jgi:hypothetical protein
MPWRYLSIQRHRRVGSVPPDFPGPLTPTISRPGLWLASLPEDFPGAARGRKGGNDADVAKPPPDGCQPLLAADCPTLACQTFGHSALCLCYAIRQGTYLLGKAEPTGNHRAVHEQDRASVRDGGGEHTPSHTFPTVTDSLPGWEALHSGSTTQVAPSTPLLAPQACFDAHTASGPAQPSPNPAYISHTHIPIPQDMYVPHIKCGGKRTPSHPSAQPWYASGLEGVGKGNNVNVRPASHPHNPPHGDSAWRC